MLSRLTEEEQRTSCERQWTTSRRSSASRRCTRRIPTGSRKLERHDEAVAAQLGVASASTKVRAIVKPSDLRARWELPRFDVRDVFDASGKLLADRLSALFTATDPPRVCVPRARDRTPAKETALPLAAVYGLGFQFSTTVIGGVGLVAGRRVDEKSLAVASGVECRGRPDREEFDGDAWFDGS